MIKPIDITNLQTESTFDGYKIVEDSLIDTTKELPKPPIAISCGYDFNNEFIPIVTYGNFACLVGASKSYKSFLKTAFEALYIGGKSQSFFSDIKGHDIKDKWIISIDTEQAKYHVQKTSKRVNSMVGIIPDNYKSFAIRPYTPEERVRFIEWIFNESEYKGKIGLMTIDGCADLVNNVNDLEKCNEITNKLMKWTSDNNCAILTVIHKNFDSNKPTGHLGSSVLKKAESVLFIDKIDNVATVKPTYTRNIPFDEFNFTINDRGLPISEKDNQIF